MGTLDQRINRSKVVLEGIPDAGGATTLKGDFVIKLKRVYDPASRDDGVRFLVERLWPRGVKKTQLKLDDWLKDVAPSPALRKWFGHDPKKWPQFQRQYFSELKAHEQSLERLLVAARRGPVTLVFSSRDTEHNNAVALRRYLERRLREV
jgi:uncharacterized protein YeaO (DUF488 family)